MTPETEQLLEKISDENPGWGKDRLAKAAGTSPSSVERWRKRRIREQHNIPDGYDVKGTSTLYDAEGKLMLQWVKTSKEREELKEQLKELVDELSEPIKKKSPLIKPPRKTDKDLLSIYPVADVHLGLYAWSEETGEDWDADKAEYMLLNAVRHLVNSSPSSDTAIIANLGDFFHTDTTENKTQASGHILDVDTRWARVLKIGRKVFREIIIQALRKHKKVKVMGGKGNHDNHSSIALAMMMDCYFENNDRVEIEIPINPFSYYRFGKNLFGFTHGMIKPDKLPMIMAADKNSEWGETLFHYWMTGHIHHKTRHEFPGCLVESFRSPSAKDSWTSANGYRSGRDLEAIYFHSDAGEVGRNRVNTELFKA